MAASLPVRPIKRRSKLSSQARSIAALSLAGSVVTNTTLTCSAISAGSSSRLLDICHVEWTLVGAMRIAEKEQSEIPLGLRQEIKRRTGCIGESKFWLRQWRSYQPPVVRRHRTTRLGQGRFLSWRRRCPELLTTPKHKCQDGKASEEKAQPHCCP